MSESGITAEAFNAVIKDLYSKPYKPLNPVAEWIKLEEYGCLGETVYHGLDKDGLFVCQIPEKLMEYIKDEDRPRA